MSEERGRRNGGLDPLFIAMSLMRRRKFDQCAVINPPLPRLGPPFLAPNPRIPNLKRCWPNTGCVQDAPEGATDPSLPLFVCRPGIPSPAAGCVHADAQGGSVGSGRSFPQQPRFSLLIIFVNSRSSASTGERRGCPFRVCEPAGGSQLMAVASHIGRRRRAQEMGHSHRDPPAHHARYRA